MFLTNSRKPKESKSKSRNRLEQSLKLTKRQVITITPKPSVQLKRRGEIHKHHDNVTTILRHSNATPIRSKGSLGYTCSFCANQYPEASDLKSHTLTTHEKQNLIFRRGHTMLTFMVKLDITSLHCNICGKNCNLIEDLVQHLTTEHDKPYHTDIKNYLVPFKFDSDVLRCVICHIKFNNFKVLLEHMNSHFKNHICEVCGEGFVNKRILLSHGYRHKKGVFNCTHCNKVFDTKVKQKEHERAVHICMNRRNKCGYCGEKFTDYTKKNEHEVRLHGAKAILLKCQACNRTFDNQRALTVHTKSYHLLEGRMRK